MNNTYARGQETFINRLVITVHNLFILLLVSAIIGALASTFILWKSLPMTFWLGQKHIFSISQSLFKKGGLLSLPEAADYYLISSMENYSLFQREFHNGFLWGAMIAVIFFALAGIFFIRRGKKMEDTKTLRGTELLSPRGFNDAYKTSLKERSRINLLKPSTLLLSYL